VAQYFNGKMTHFYLLGIIVYRRVKAGVSEKVVNHSATSIFHFTLESLIIFSFINHTDSKAGSSPHQSIVVSNKTVSPIDPIWSRPYRYQLLEETIFFSSRVCVTAILPKDAKKTMK
jgi:hypothetical protein